MSLQCLLRTVSRLPVGARGILTVAENNDYWASALNQKPFPKTRNTIEKDESDWIESEKNQKPPKTPLGPSEYVFPNFNPPDVKPPTIHLHK
mgnify:FL=1